MASIHPINPAAMKSTKEPESGTQYDLVFATGCSGSGWEAVLPIFKDSGVVIHNTTLTNIYDEIFQDGNIYELNDLRQEMLPHFPLSTKAQDLTKHFTSPILFADSRTIWLLEYWAQNFPTAYFLLFYTQRATALSHAIHHCEGDLDKFLNRWRVVNTQILKFYKQYKDRALLINTDIAIQAPKKLLKVCKVFGSNFKSSMFSENYIYDASELDHYIASHLLKTSKADRSLIQGLEANQCNLKRSSDTEILSSQKAYSTYIDQKFETERLRKQFDLLQTTLTEEKIKLLSEQKNTSDLLSQLKIVNNDLANVRQDYVSSKYSAEREITKLKSEILEHQETISRNEILISHLERENDLLLIHLHQIQEEFESIFLERAMSIREEIVDSRSHKGDFLGRIRKLFFNPKDYWLDIKIERDIKEIKKSKLFNEAWYLLQYSDVAVANFNPIRHYLMHGALEGRNPSANFDTLFYIKNNSDVANAGLNPLLHYIRCGRKEKRPTTPQWGGF